MNNKKVKKQQQNVQLLVFNETGCRARKMYWKNKRCASFYEGYVYVWGMYMYVCMCFMAQRKNVCIVYELYNVKCTCVVRIIYMAGKETQ
jgi:hypothetical protein